MIRKAIAGLTMFIILGTSLYAEIKPEQVIQTVDSAFEYIEENGNRGLRKMNKEMSQKWLKGELYPFIVDCKSGLTLVHAKKAVLGVNLVTRLKDKVTGRYFLKDLCEMTGKNPNGIWQTYWWPKPKETKSSKKVSYAVRSKKFPTYMIGAGIYSETINAEKLNSQK